MPKLWKTGALLCLVLLLATSIPFSGAEHGYHVPMASAECGVSGAKATAIGPGASATSSVASGGTTIPNNIPPLYAESTTTGGSGGGTATATATPAQMATCSISTSTFPSDLVLECATPHSINSESEPSPDPPYELNDFYPALSYSSDLHHVVTWWGHYENSPLPGPPTWTVDYVDDRYISTGIFASWHPHIYIIRSIDGKMSWGANEVDHHGSPEIYLGASESEGVPLETNGWVRVGGSGGFLGAGYWVVQSDDLGIQITATLTGTNSVGAGYSRSCSVTA